MPATLGWPAVYRGPGVRLSVSTVSLPRVPEQRAAHKVIKERSPPRQRQGQLSAVATLGVLWCSVASQTP
jgi:hypothetical protein